MRVPSEGVGTGLRSRGITVRIATFWVTLPAPSHPILAWSNGHVYLFGIHHKSSF